MGLITGRKAFQKPMKDGIEILNLVQDIYLNKKVTISLKPLQISQINSEL